MSVFNAVKYGDWPSSLVRLERDEICVQSNGVYTMNEKRPQMT